MVSIGRSDCKTSTGFLRMTSTSPPTTSASISMGKEVCKDISAPVAINSWVMGDITQELIATGAEMSLHTSLPIEIEADVVGGEVEVILRNPVDVLQSERPIETIHGHVIPFTAIVNATVETPLMSLPTMKTIASGTPASKIELPIGGSLGLSMNLRYQSEATSLFSYLRSFLAR